MAFCGAGAACELTRARKVDVSFQRGELKQLGDKGSLRLFFLIISLGAHVIDPSFPHYKSIHQPPLNLTGAVSYPGKEKSC